MLQSWRPSVARLFGRTYRLQVGRQVVTELDISFRVKTSVTRQPNTAEISIKNLNESNRRRIEQSQEGVALHAGYGDAPGAIFLGEVKTAVTTRERADLVTKMECTDGGRQQSAQRTNRSFGSGARITDVIAQLGQDLGVGMGNLEQVAASAEFPGLGQTFPRGTALNGNTARQLDMITRSAGLEWSIQRGAFQFTQRARPLAGQAVVLSASTGLLGTPAKDKDRTVSARSNIIPNLFPGRQVTLESLNIRGQYRATRCEYVGDTRGPDWYIDHVLKDINA